MSKLVRWDPVREMLSLRDSMDRFLEEPFFQNPRLWERSMMMEWNLALDVAEEDDAYVVTASLPGIAPEDVEITLTDNVLTIQGEISKDEEIDEQKYHIRERRFGRFGRSVTLPNAVAADQVEAVSENGVLKLTLPKTEEVKPKRIEIRKQIEHK